MLMIVVNSIGLDFCFASPTPKIVFPEKQSMIFIFYCLLRPHWWTSFCELENSRLLQLLQLVSTSASPSRVIRGPWLFWVKPVRWEVLKAERWGTEKETKWSQFRKILTDLEKACLIDIHKSSWIYVKL